MAELHHECGIAAVYQLADAARDERQPVQLVAQMLADMQNRGQQAAGVSVCSPKTLQTHKRLGMVRDALADIPAMPGRAAIGHVRYATCGANELRFAQPFERPHHDPRKWFTLAFNGQLANFETLCREIPALLDAECDTEVLRYLIAAGLDASPTPDLPAVFRDLCARLDGAYNLVFLNAAGELVVLRDPTGIRPLCWATDGERFAAASESWPLTRLGFADVCSLMPGEMIHVKDDSVGRNLLARRASEGKTSHCFFEWIYFANPESVLDGKRVADVRASLGQQLATHERLSMDDNTVVVPVPRTARHAAAAMARGLSLPLVDGVEVNEMVDRTFIEGADRESKVRAKFTFRADLLTGKRVLLVEDTLIRGTTLRSLVADLREQGRVAEVHVRIACPPIIAPCYYGIDIATVGELFAPKFTFHDELTPRELAAMACELGADSVAYLPLEAISQAIGLAPTRLCQACTTGRYPTPAGQQLYDLAVRNRTKVNGHVTRPGARAAIAQSPRNR